jgi:hypothetical protein
MKKALVVATDHSRLGNTGHKAGFGSRGEMSSTIVEYTDEKPPINLYPKRIISPTHGNTCCAVNMEQIGGIKKGDKRSYFYRRCRDCGYTVRHFLPAPVSDTPSGPWEDETTSLLRLVA